MMYNSTHVVALFNVTRQTVADWSNEFARHLSPTANPPRGGHRRFTDNDMEVFTLVSEMRKVGLGFSDIHASLDAGQRGAIPLPDANALAVIDGPPQVALLRQTVDALEKQVSELHRQVRSAEQERDRTVGENTILKSLYKESLNRIEALNREISKLETQIESDE